jgi:hypothetical protein
MKIAGRDSTTRQISGFVSRGNREARFGKALCSPEVTNGRLGDCGLMPDQRERSIHGSAGGCVARMVEVWAVVGSKGSEPRGKAAFGFVIGPGRMGICGECDPPSQLAIRADFIRWTPRGFFSTFRSGIW